MQLNEATILLVDDEPDLLEIMSEWFRREGCTVLTAENGALACDLVQTNQVDVIVSDIHMPVMDGVTMLTRIRSTNTYKPSVMFITGFYDMESREAHELGAEALISKPVERKELIAVVKRMLTPRDELWRSRQDGRPGASIHPTFKSLEASQTEELLIFGRGGFCARSSVNLKVGPVDFQLDFEAENRKVTGHGIVRWCSLSEGQVGVEISDIDDENRDWLADLCARNSSRSFIPRSTRAIERNMAASV